MNYKLLIGSVFLFICSDNYDRQKRKFSLAWIVLEIFVIPTQ